MISQQVLRSLTSPAAWEWYLYFMLQYNTVCIVQCVRQDLHNHTKLSKRPACRAQPDPGAVQDPAVDEQQPGRWQQKAGELRGNPASAQNCGVKNCHIYLLILHIHLNILQITC